MTVPHLEVVAREGFRPTRTPCVAGTLWRTRSLPATLRMRADGPALLAWHNDPLTRSWDHAARASDPVELPLDYDVLVDGELLEQVRGNTLHSRHHLLDLQPGSVVELVVRRAAPEGACAALALQALPHAAPRWLFVGDSITCAALDHDPRGDASQTLGALVTAAGGPPVWHHNAGVPGITASDAVAHAPRWLDACPCDVVVLALGTNDANRAPAGDPDVGPRVARALHELVELALERGAVPVLPRIPFGATGGVAVNGPAINLSIQLLLEQFGGRAVEGPDLWHLLAADAALLGDDLLHPSDAGLRALRSEWAQFVARWHTTAASAGTAGLQPH